MKKQYYYINHKDHGPLRITGGGGFTCGKWEGLLHGIMDLTLFPSKNLARKNLVSIRKYKTLNEKKKFSLVKFNFNY